MRTKTARVASKYIKKSSENLEIHIYDFDLTLFRSPNPPKWWSSSVYEQWFSHQSSLGLPFIEVNPSSEFWVSPVVKKAKESINDLNVWTVMCTGRIDTGSIRYRVAELLKLAGLDFENVFLNRSGLDTEKYKVEVLRHLLKKFPQVKKVQMWEDTQKNLDSIESVCNRVGIEFEGHLISVSPVNIDYISEEDYLDFLKEELPEREFNVLYRKYLRRNKK